MNRRNFLGAAIGLVCAAIARPQVAAIPAAQVSPTALPLDSLGARIATINPHFLGVTGAAWGGCVVSYVGKAKLTPIDPTQGPRLADLRYDGVVVFEEAQAGRVTT